MSMLGPYASWNKETGYAVWDHPTAEYTGIFERINVGIKGIIHVGMWDFVEYGCYTKLVGNKVVGVEANPEVYRTMAKPVADKWGFKCFNEFTSDKDAEVRNFYFAGEGSSLYQISNFGQGSRCEDLGFVRGRDFQILAILIISIQAFMLLKMRFWWFFYIP